MKIALIQNNPVTGAIKENAAALLRAVEKAGREGADLCVAPELALCGHNAADLLLRSDFIEACSDTLQEMATHLVTGVNLPPFLLGAPVANPVPQGKGLQNCAVLLHEGKVSVIGRKVLLSSGCTHNDSQYFEPGVACGVLQYNGWRFAVAIGEDVWNNRTFWRDRRMYDSDPVAEFMAAGGADGLINLTALAYTQGGPQLYQQMLSWIAAQYRVPVLAANLVGGNDSQVYYGASLAFDGEGTLVGRAQEFEEDSMMISMTDKSIQKIVPEMPLEEELWKAIVLGTKDFGRKCGFQKAVLGLSGGIDSALVAALAVDAFGADNITGILMPSRYSSSGSIDDSLTLAKGLGIATHTLPITPLMEAYEQSFERVFAEGLQGIAEENIQARIRGSLLMAHANRFGSLVLITGNKSEASVGYSTLYGDMAGGLAPIGDLYKTQVYALCAWYNTVGHGAIPDIILEKAPSAELRPDQKDEDSLPPYDILDALLHDIIEGGLSAKELVENGYDTALVSRILKLLHGAEFKRHQAPPVVQLSARGYGGGWRMPIAAVIPCS